MPISGPFQWEIRAYVIGGAADVWKNDRSRSIGGFGPGAPKTSDLPYAGRGGSFGGDDLDDVRTLTIPLYTVGTGASDLARQESAMSNLASLETAWAYSNVDVRLDGWLPGRRFYIMGRPRGIDEDLSKLTFGHVAVLCTFVTTVDNRMHPVV